MKQQYRAGALGLVLVAACGSEEERAGALAQAIELEQRGVIYDVAFAAAPSLAQLRESKPELTDEQRAQIFRRELAVQALPYWSSGSVTMPTGNMAPAPAQSRIRYSCGATLISPSFVITAGHCPTRETELDELRLQMYRPTAELEHNWQKATVVSGTFPLLSHPQLSEADGYVLDEYACVVRTRCYDGDVNCPDATWDVAVLECEGRPGDKYGYLDFGVASVGAEALVHWKHEVLDVHDENGDVLPDLDQHYVQYGLLWENYHYFESGNQLLPLRSIPWSDGSPNRFLSASEVDVHGCHGTSGSGILVRVGGSAEFRLVGPAAGAGRSLDGRLCQRVPNPGGMPSGPGQVGIALSLDNPSALLDQYAEELEQDCAARGKVARDTASLPFAPGSYRPHTLFSFLSCALHPFARSGSVTADEAFGAYRDRLLDDSPAPERIVDVFELEADADYRVALHAQSLGDCPDCPQPQLRVGDDTIELDVSLSANRAVLAHAFAAPAAGPIELGITHAGSGLAVGGLTLVREGRVSTFDAIEDRLEASLHALDDDGQVLVGPVPARFAGDGSAGYQAWLQRGERITFSRQALGAGRLWTVRLGSTTYEELSCGLLALDGAPALSVSCAELFQLDDSAGTEARLAFFVELPSTSQRERANIAYFALASDLARDLDGNEVPDVLDDCPEEGCPEQPEPDGGGGAGGAPEGGAAAGGAGAGGASEGGASEGGASEGGASEGGASEGGASEGGSGGSSVTAGKPSAAGAGAQGGTDSLGGDGDSGCGCRVGRSAGEHAWLSLLLLGGLLWRRRRHHTRAQ